MDFLKNSLKNLLNELKKNIYVKTTYVNGVEKSSFEFENNCHEMVEKFIISLSSNVKNDQPTSITEENSSLPKTIPPATTTDNKIPWGSSDPKPDTSNPKPDTSNPAPVSIKKDAPVDDIEKARPEINQTCPPGFESKKVGELKTYCVENNIPLTKPSEWYKIKLTAYGVSETICDQHKNLNKLHRELLGGLDANGNFILWQYKWLVYNHQNGNNLYENTFCVDLSRMRKPIEEIDVVSSPSPKAQKASKPASKEEKSVVEPEEEVQKSEVDIEMEKAINKKKRMVLAFE